MLLGTSFVRLLAMVWASLDIISSFILDPSLRWDKRVWADPPPSNIGGGCAFGAKKGFCRRRTRLVSCFQQASKKSFEISGFCSQVYARLIEKLRWPRGQQGKLKLKNQRAKVWSRCATEFYMGFFGGGRVAINCKTLQNVAKGCKTYTKNCKMLPNVAKNCKKAHKFCVNEHLCGSQPKACWDKRGKQIKENCFIFTALVPLRIFSSLRR